MKLFFSFFISLFSVCILSFSLTFAQEVQVDLDAGEQIFTQNCVACHAGGENLVNPAKTLSFADLEKNEKNSVKAIINQVTNGASGMPVFSGRLSEEEITNVANFVFSQATNNSW